MIVVVASEPSLSNWVGADLPEAGVVGSVVDLPAIEFQVMDAPVVPVPDARASARVVVGGEHRGGGRDQVLVLPPGGGGSPGQVRQSRVRRDLDHVHCAAGMSRAASRGSVNACTPSDGLTVTQPMYVSVAPLSLKTEHRVFVDWAMSMLPVSFGPSGTMSSGQLDTSKDRLDAFVKVKGRIPPESMADKTTPVGGIATAIAAVVNNSQVLRFMA